jgi:hypothetical protein
MVEFCLWLCSYLHLLCYWHDSMILGGKEPKINVLLEEI